MKYINRFSPDSWSAIKTEAKFALECHLYILCNFNHILFPLSWNSLSYYLVPNQIKGQNQILYRNVPTPRFSLSLLCESLFFNISICKTISIFSRAILWIPMYAQHTVSNNNNHVVCSLNVIILQVSPPLPHISIFFLFIVYLTLSQLGRSWNN